MKPVRLLRELRALVGKDNVLSSPIGLATYTGDATALEGRADAVVFPASTEQAAAVVRLCHRERVPVTPRGAGTDLSGGAVPFVVLSALTGPTATWRRSRGWPGRT